MYQIEFEDTLHSRLAVNENTNRCQEYHRRADGEKDVGVLNNNCLAYYFRHCYFNSHEQQTDDSQSSIDTAPFMFREFGDYSFSSNLQGPELEYNSLLAQHENKTNNHFSVLNSNVKTLLDKRSRYKHLDAVAKTKAYTQNKKFNEEIASHDMGVIFNAFNYPPNCQDNIESMKSDANDQKNEDLSSFTVKNSIKEFSIDSNADAQVIPDKFKNKKFPYLNKKIRSGYLKFFDEKNNFGFITLKSEPFGEVFIFGKEFVKANISDEMISIACNNPSILFRFRIMHYIGKHGESKKAVNIRL